MAVIDWNSLVVADKATVLFETNPILALNQLGYENDTGRFKVGTGSAHWNDMAYLAINNQQSVWIGVDPTAGNLLDRDITTGGLRVSPDKFASAATLVAALAVSATPSDQDARPVIAPIHRIGVMLRNIIDTMGSDYTGLKTNNIPTKTIKARMDELEAAIGSSGGGLLQDTITATTSTWSSTKIDAFTTLKVAAAIAELVGEAPETLDTIYKLAAAFGENQNLVTTIAADLANTVRFNIVQSLNATQKAQARSNIGAASADQVGNENSSDVDSTMINELMGGFTSDISTVPMYHPPIA